MKPLDIRIKRETLVPALLVFNRGGHTLYFKRDKTSTTRELGYDDPETFFTPSKWWAHDYMTQRDAAQFEGVPWLNHRAACDTDAGWQMAIRGPMVDVDLPDGDIAKCPQPDAILVGAIAGTQFGTLISLQAESRIKREPAGPLDSVSVAEYIRLWKAAGAETGVIHNGQFTTP